MQFIPYTDIEFSDIQIKWCQIKVFSNNLLFLMLRSRIKEHLENVVREDLLTVFGRKVDLRSLQCSIILHKNGLYNEARKKLAVGLLKILTGQSPILYNCNPL